MIFQTRAERINEFNLCECTAVYRFMLISDIE
jgi:hypothetical protein